MANVEVKQGKPTYTLTLDEDEFWTVLVALGLTDDEAVAWSVKDTSYLRMPEGFQPRSYELWWLMKQTVGEPE